MRSVEQQDGQPQPKPANIERRKFLQGAIVGGLTVYCGINNPNTEAQLLQVSKDVDEELKSKGIVPPTEEEKQAAFEKQHYGAKVISGEKPPISREEAERNIDEALETQRKAQEYGWLKDDMVGRKAPFLILRNVGEKVGLVGGAIMIGKRIYNELRGK